MGVEVAATAIAEVKVVTPQVFCDARGWFCETWSGSVFAAQGIEAAFVQDNQSLSRDLYTLRGLHFQKPPRAQGKLVRCLKGSILDIAVDIRHGSPTFGRHVAEVLSEENRKQMYVPMGFAHAFLTLTPDSEVFYKVTDTYAPDCDVGIAWDDPALGIDWGVPFEAISCSDKDRRHPRLADLPPLFVYGQGC
ncbi:MAG: dTDP-4-dehydrorhamnose 3,5-epimerase [Rhodospirillaceae bacterium]